MPAEEKKVTEYISSTGELKRLPTGGYYDHVCTLCGCWGEADESLEKTINDCKRSFRYVYPKDKRWALENLEYMNKFRRYNDWPEVTIEDLLGGTDHDSKDITGLPSTE